MYNHFFCRGVVFFGLTIVAAMRATALTQVQLPLDPQETVVTCFSGLTTSYGNVADLNGYVVAIVDTRIPEIAGNPVPTLDTNWMVSMYHNELGSPSHKWDGNKLGQVFGLCQDGATNKNIYVAATTVYGQFAAGPAGAGAIYRIDGTSGNICTFAQLPNGGPGLGNLAFDPVSNHIFASNHDDGLIYSIPVGSGCGQTQWTTYDHGRYGRPAAGVLPAILDDGVSGNFTALGRRVWGVCVYNGRLYYGVWWEDSGRPNASQNNEIWSVQIDGSGNCINATAIREYIIPPYSGGYPQNTNPVADIEFTATGGMLAAERSMIGDTGQLHLGNAGASHQSRVLKFTGTSGSFTMLPDTTYRIGAFGQATNSSGGVSSDCEENVWGTGDALHYGFSTGHTDTVYGLHRVNAAGNTTDSPATVNGYVIGLAPPSYHNGYAKTEIGEVDYIRDCPTVSDCPNSVITSCTGGVKDQFAASNGTEYAAPDAALLASVTCAGGPLTTFDTPAIRQCFVHTLTDCCKLPSDNCRPIGMHLQIGLKAGDQGVATGTDTISLGQGGNSYWSAPLANLTNTGQWQSGTWNPGQQMLLNLDLFALPTSATNTYNILSDLTECKLDVKVAQYTMVDFVTLEIEWCCEEPEGEGASEGAIEGEGPCMEISNGEALCESGPAGMQMDYTFDVTNLSGVNAAWVLLTPQTAGITITPNIIPTNLPNGGTQTYNVTITGLQPGEEACFTVTLQDDKHKECCSDTVCVENPCNCVFLQKEEIVCKEDGTWSYSFVMTNLSAFTMEHLYLFVDSPAGATISPGYIDIPTLLPGATSGPINVVISGANPGDELCFTLTVHDKQLDECCSFQQCIELPKCCDDDHEPPTIACPPNLTIDCGAPFQFQATVTDNCDEAATITIKYQGQIDTSKPGNQCVIVYAIDSAGNQAIADCCITVLDNCNGTGLPVQHSADYNGDEEVSISEMLRVVQIFNVGSYHCDTSTEDGFAPGPGGDYEHIHSSDYLDQDWKIEMAELLRLVQIYNVGGYEPCSNGEDGYCPVQK